MKLIITNLQLSGKLEEVGEEPEEVGLVHGGPGGLVAGEVGQELLHQTRVAIVEEVNSELFQQLCNNIDVEKYLDTHNDHHLKYHHQWEHG